MIEGAAWAAVIVVWNAGDDLLRCVDSILADPTGLPAELIVVDNASDDDAVERAAAKHPEVRVIRAPGNLGYGRGANLGISASAAPVVAVLNADLEFVPGCARAMVDEFADDVRVGAVAPRLVNPDGTTYPSARTHPRTVDAVGHAALGLIWPTNPFTRRYRQLDVDPTVRRDVDWLSGAALWLRRAALDEVGAFDDRYFMYFEDVDLGWRLRRGGWRCRFQPAGVVHHTQGGATRHRPIRMIVAHHRSAWIHARDRYPGWRQVALPFVGSALALRMLCVIALQWVRRAPNRPQVRG